MGVVLDLIASMSVRAAIIYIVITMNIQLHELLFEKAQHAIVKQNMATVTDVMQNDFRYIGYNVSGTVFLTADLDRVKFLGDMDNNGSADTLTIYVGPKSEMSQTPNPDDRILYRKKNSETPVEYGHGITTLNIKYYDANGNVTTNKSDIRSLWIKLIMEGDRQINEIYPTSIWETFLIPPNI